MKNIITMSGIIHGRKLRNKKIDEGIVRELERQKANGKKFITDKEIDEIIDSAIKQYCVTK